MDLMTTVRWGVRAFPLRSGAQTPGIRHAIVPEVFDVSGVRRGEHGRLEVVGAVRLSEDGALLDDGRSEVAIAVVIVGDTIPGWTTTLRHGPRYLGAVAAADTGWTPGNPEERRPAWAYFLGSQHVLGNADIYASEFEMVP